MSTDAALAGSAMLAAVADAELAAGAALLAGARAESATDPGVLAALADEAHAHAAHAALAVDAAATWSPLLSVAETADPMLRAFVAVDAARHGAQLAAAALAGSGD